MGDGSFCVVDRFLLQQPQAAQDGGQLVALDGALRAFAAALRLDRVLVIPDGQPPHKALAEESPDPETRLHLCRLAAEDLPFAEVSDLELRRTGKSYTAETVRAALAQWPSFSLQSGSAWLAAWRRAFSNNV